jgi:hypothetical protein
MTLHTRIPGLLLALTALLAASCNVVTLEDWPCPPGGTKLTYYNFGGAYFSSYCNSCHSAPDGQRNGAPDDENFSTLAGIRAHKDLIFVNAAASNDAMPPGPDAPPIAERNQLADWLACGAP